jgi:hypothetical protein
MKLTDVRKIALALPESAEQPHFQYTSFRVKGKIFATAPPEGTHLHVMLGEHESRAAVADDPDHCELLPWGAKIAGVRVTLAKADPARVGELLEDAWRAKAPKTLVKKRDADQR